MRAYLDLCGLKISLFASLAALTGFILSAGRPDARATALVIGVFALACGARSLNQYQELETDRLMPRTMKRPLPSGRLRPAEALLFSGCLILFGLVTLLLTGPAGAPLLGLFAVCWYNGLYTRLKRYSAFAVVPGALAGAAPPAIGWAAAGGPLGDSRLSALCFFFFMWQVPHFWIFNLRFAEEYSAAGLPSLTRKFSGRQLGRIIFSWVSAAAASSLLLAGRGVVRHTIVYEIIAFVSVVVVVGGALLLVRRDRRMYAAAFRGVNLYALAVMAALVADRLWFHYMTCPGLCCEISATSMQ
ncbi:MAG: UbiA family prenyltransferase [Nitrospiraceae bacterium]|nr:UbiA family prenyltransferase [Nitrospiraceae bacterium]